MAGPRDGGGLFLRRVEFVENDLDADTHKLDQFGVCRLAAVVFVDTVMGSHADLREIRDQLAKRS